MAQNFNIDSLRKKILHNPAFVNVFCYARERYKLTPAPEKKFVFWGRIIWGQIILSGKLSGGELS
jgi:hypothetical protein